MEMKNQTVFGLQGCSSGLITSQSSAQPRLVFPLLALTCGRVDGLLLDAHLLLSGVMPHRGVFCRVCAAGAASCALVGLLCALDSRTNE